jgi:hypothetical protein
MGQALFRSVCSYPQPTCTTCPVAGACTYPALFKPVIETELAPFWLHGWLHGRKGWQVGIRWLGDRRYAVGEWLAALGQPDTGLSFHGSGVRLDHATLPGTASPVWRVDAGWLEIPVVLPALPLATDGAQTRCTVKFLTPLVSKHAGDPLFGALHTRLQRLVQLHGDGSQLSRPAQPWICHIAGQKSRRIPLARRILSGTEWQLELDRIDMDAWSLLRAGIELHAGGQTGMGCGHYVFL